MRAMIHVLEGDEAMSNEDGKKVPHDVNEIE
jgi:hypothetical protein